MKHVRFVSVVVFCALFTFSSSGLAMSSKKVSSGSRDVASERDVASVEHESKGVPQLISYDELKKLSPERRAEYIEGVRGMLLTLAAKSGKDFPMFAGGNTPEEAYSLLEALLPAAYAQEYENTGKRPETIRPRFLRKQYLNNFEKWTCDSEVAKFDFKVGTCVDKVGKRSNPLENCGSGYKAAYMKNTGIVKWVGSPVAKYCVPQGSWNLLSAKRKSELSNTDGANSVEHYFAYRIDDKPDKYIGAEVALGGTKKITRVQPALAVPEKDDLRARSSAGNAGYACNSTDPRVHYNMDVGTCTGQEIKGTDKCPTNWKRVILAKDDVGPWNTKKYFCVTPASWEALSRNRQIELTEPTPGKESNVATNKDREDSLKKRYGGVTITLPPATPYKGEVAKEETAATTPEAAAPKVVERTPSEEVALGGAPCAGISELSCPSKEDRAMKRKTAEEWYRKNVETCVFAGNISSFRSGKNAANNCEAVTSMSKPKLSCTDGVLCNPIVFGVKEDGQPFCSIEYSEATRNCHEMSSKGAKANWLDENISSIKNEWNKLAQGMSAACGRNAAREYFCDECNIMMERLASLRVLALNRDAEGVCHAPVMAHAEATKARKTDAPKAEKAKQ